MSSPTLYKKGDWKAVCDVCGQRYLMSKLRKRWDGLMVCSNDFEPRQPQDFVRAKVDIQAVPVARPESTNYTYIQQQYPWVSGFAIAGYMTGGTNTGPGGVPSGTFTP